MFIQRRKKRFDEGGDEDLPKKNRPFKLKTARPPTPPPNTTTITAATSSEEPNAERSGWTGQSLRLRYELIFGRRRDSFRIGYQGASLG